MNIFACGAPLSRQRVWAAALGGIALAAGLAGTRAEEAGPGIGSAPIDVSVNSQISMTEERGAGEKVAGAGEARTRSVLFTLHMNNRQLDAVSDIRCKVYVVGYTMDPKKVGGKVYSVVKVLEKGELELPTGADCSVEIGTVDFKETQQLAAKGNAVSYAGDFYVGDVLEVYIGEKLVDVVMEGPVRKPYQAAKSS